MDTHANITKVTDYLFKSVIAGHNFHLPLLHIIALPSANACNECYLSSKMKVWSDFLSKISLLHPLIFNWPVDFFIQTYFIIPWNMCTLQVLWVDQSWRNQPDLVRTLCTPYTPTCEERIKTARWCETIQYCLHFLNYSKTEIFHFFFDCIRGNFHGCLYLFF